MLSHPDRYRSCQYDSDLFIELKLEITTSTRINEPAPPNHFRLVPDMAFLFAFKMIRNIVISVKRKNTAELLIRRAGSWNLFVIKNGTIIKGSTSRYDTLNLFIVSMNDLLVIR